MTVQSQAAKYLLLRVERSRREGSASPVRSFATFDEAIAAAAEQPHQPSARWRPDWVDGVWRQVDWTGRGFSVHRIDDPATGFGDNGNGGGTAVSARPRAASQLKVTGPWKADGTDES